MTVADAQFPQRTRRRLDLERNPRGRLVKGLLIISAFPLTASLLCSRAAAGGGSFVDLWDVACGPFLLNTECQVIAWVLLALVLLPFWVPERALRRLAYIAAVFYWLACAGVFGLRF